MMKKLLGRKKEKTEKKAKRALHLFGLCAAFCAGAACMGVLVFKNREKLAVMTVGKRNIRRRRLKK